MKKNISMMLAGFAALLRAVPAFAAEKAEEAAAAAVVALPVAPVQVGPAAMPSGLAETATMTLATNSAAAVARSAEQVTRLSQYLSRAIYSLIEVMVGAFLALPGIMSRLWDMTGDPLERRRLALGAFVVFWVLGSSFMVFKGLRPTILFRLRALGRRWKPSVMMLRAMMAGGDAAVLLVFLLLTASVLSIMPAEIPAREVGIAIVWATCILEALRMVARFFLVADDPKLFAPLVCELGVRPETGYYLFIWSRRLVIPLVYGWLALEFLHLGGIGGDTRMAVFNLIGMALTILLSTFILQNREHVAAFLSGGKKGRHRLAHTWHILAVASIVSIYGVFLLDMEAGNFRALTIVVMTLAVFVVAMLFLVAMKFLIHRMFRLSHDVVHRFPELEKRAARHERTFSRIVFALVWLFALLALLRVWEIDISTLGTDNSMKQVLDRLTSVGMVMAMAWFVWCITAALIDYTMGGGRPGGEPSPRARSFMPILHKISAVVITLFAFMIGVVQLGVDPTHLLAGVGVIGIAIGFGAQSFIKDFITGMFMLGGNVMAVGDFIDISGIAGTVEEVGMRTVILRDFNGSLCTIPFSEIKTLINMTRDFSCAVLDIGVAYNENVDRAMGEISLLAEAMRQDPAWQADIVDVPEILGVQELAESSVVLRLRLKTLPGRQWAVSREFRRRVKNRFDEIGIEIPYPHVRVYMGRPEKSLLSASTTEQAVS